MPDQRLFAGVYCLISSLVTHTMAMGHWVDSTRPIANWHKRMACWMVSMVMAAIGMFDLLSMVVSPEWAIIFAMTLYFALIVSHLNRNS